MYESFLGPAGGCGIVYSQWFLKRYRHTSHTLV